MMLVSRSADARPASIDPAVSRLLAAVAEDRLREIVEAFAFPRHYIAEPAANARARDLLLDRLRGFGYEPVLQGEHDNVVVYPPGGGPCRLFAAHYDSVPGTPGADDNASAVAACLECARLLKEHGVSPAAFAFAFFNREEDGLLGSREFVRGLAAEPGRAVAEAHVFEMVGYRVRGPGSQRTPPGLPVAAPDVGDFLALVSNEGSNAVADGLLSLAAGHVPGTPVLALKTFAGAERVADLLRSDHVPFWEAGLPAVMWTDTSEFRNPHYHRPTDTPDTLDYAFLADVTRLALARAATV